MKKYAFFFFLLSSSLSSYSQSLIASAGMAQDVDGYTIGWSLGEPFTKTLTNDGIHLTQGFHQPEEGSLTIHHAPDLQTTYCIFPNPSHGEISISASEPVTSLKITLIDLNGRIYTISPSVDLPAKIHLPPVSKGLYILQAHHKDNTCAFRGKISIY